MKTKMQFTFQRRKWQNAVLKTISVKLLPFYPKPLKWIIGLPSEELWNYQMNVPLRYGAVHIYQIRATLLDLLFWKGFVQKWNIFEKCSSFLLLYCDKIMTSFSSLIAKACIYMYFIYPCDSYLLCLFVPRENWQTNRKWWNFVPIDGQSQLSFLFASLWLEACLSMDCNGLH